MMKKNLMLLFVTLAVLQGAAVCRAEILPAHGEGQIGWQAAVLCESLTVYKEQSAASEAVQTLPYGRTFSVMSEENGWAQCCLSDDVDAAPAGWVNADYIIVNPAWYRTNETTQVFAWDDTAAPKVALLDSGVMLPILKEEGDWLIVSLRGATGWIRKNAADYAGAQAQSDAASGTDAAAQGSGSTSGGGASFTVYAKDGSTVQIHSVGGAMYEDEKGRTYSNKEGNTYYCIETDITYSSDPNAWSDGGPGPDHVWTGADFGENPDYVYEGTGTDYGENPDYVYEGPLTYYDENAENADN